MVGPDASADVARDAFQGRRIQQVTMLGASLVLATESPLPSVIVLPWPWRVVQPRAHHQVRVEACGDLGTVSVVAEATMWRREFERVSAEMVQMKQRLRHEEARA